MAEKCEIKTATEILMKHDQTIGEVIESLRTQLDQALKQNKAHYEMGREQQAIQDAEKIAACQAHNAELRELSGDLVQRWDTPYWKDAEHTGAFIARLRDAICRPTDTEALDAAIAKAVEGCAEFCGKEAAKIWLYYNRENPDLYQEG